MGFFKTGLNCLTKKYFNFSDRSPRREYWSFVVVSSLLSFLFSFMGGLFFFISFANQLEGVGVLKLLFGYYLFFIILFLAMIVPGLSIWFRRIHDLNYSGWWIFIPSISYSVCMIALGYVAQGGFSYLVFTAMGALSAIIYFVVWLKAMFQKGTKGDNKYGSDPLEGK